MHLKLSAQLEKSLLHGHVTESRGEVAKEEKESVWQ